MGGCPPAGAEGPRGEDQLPRRPEGRSPEGRENFVPKDRANEGGGVVDERRSGVRTHRSRSRSESSMLMFGGSLSRTAVESSSSNDAKDQSGNKFQRNQLAKNSRVLHGPLQKPKAQECHWELDWQKLKFAHRRRRSRYGPRDKRPGVGSRRGGTARLGAPRDGQDRAGRGRGKGAATAKAARPASSEVARKWAAPAIQPLAVLLDDDDDGGPTPLPLCLSWAREERFARLLRRLAVGVSGVGGGECTTCALSK